MNSFSTVGLRTELSEELRHILDFWMQKMPDRVNGGWLGAMDHKGLTNPEALKGAVMNARILWTFSTAALVLNDKEVRHAAEHAFQWFNEHFFDREYGGIYWSVTCDGKPLETKKQVYAQAFALYGLSAYYALTGDNQVLEMAIGLFRLIEAHSYDEANGGYFEAFNRQWKPMEDLRLSEKDANEKKTMNTHLHVLEAYTLLYKYWPNVALKKQIEGLLQVFRERIIQPETGSLGLFFDEYWNRKDTLISYGHDIESSWLLQEAAKAIDDKGWLDWANKTSILLVNGSMAGIDEDGGMWHEFNFASNHLLREKHWWPQAEAMVGFCNVWQHSGNTIYGESMIKSWEFIKTYILDKNLGEWKWGVLGDYSVMEQEDFAGFWKCPYHNGRACLELMHRLAGLP